MSYKFVRISGVVTNDIDYTRNFTFSQLTLHTENSGDVDLSVANIVNDDNSFIQHEFSSQDDVVAVSVTSNWRSCVVSKSDDGLSWEVLGYCKFNAGSISTIDNFDNLQYKYCRFKNLPKSISSFNIVSSDISQPQLDTSKLTVSSTGQDSIIDYLLDVDNIFSFDDNDTNRQIIYEFDVMSQLYCVQIRCENDLPSIDVEFSNDGIEWSEKKSIINAFTQSVTKTFLMHELIAYSQYNNNVSNFIDYTYSLNFAESSSIIATTYSLQPLTVIKPKVFQVEPFILRRVFVPYNDYVLKLPNGNVISSATANKDGDAHFTELPLPATIVDNPLELAAYLLSLKIYTRSNDLFLDLKDAFEMPQEPDMNAKRIYGFAEGKSFSDSLTFTLLNDKFQVVETFINTYYDFVTYVNIVDGVYYLNYDNKTQLVTEYVTDMTNGYLSGNVNTDCQGSNFKIRCFREDGFFIGDYDITDNQYYIENLNVNTTYDVLLYDTSLMAETLVNSRRKPIEISNT